jgi:hypothetical protein
MVWAPAHYQNCSAQPMKYPSVLQRPRRDVGECGSKRGKAESSLATTFALTRDGLLMETIVTGRGFQITVSK